MLCLRSAHKKQNTMEQKKINDKGWAYCEAAYAYVSPDGKKVEREITDYQTGEVKRWNAPVKKECGLPCIITNKKKGTIMWMEELVATAYCPKPQEEGMIVKHKDGDLTNNAANNLEWIVPTPEEKWLIKKAEYKLYFESIGYRIKNGEVYQKGQKISYRSSGYDSDVDWFYERLFADIDYTVLNRWGRYDRKWIEADILMDIFGLVAGDRMAFEHPKVLHIDNTRLNYKPENLLWVDESDKRYTNYLAAIKADCIEKEKEANKGKCVPPSRRDLLGTDWV